MSPTIYLAGDKEWYSGQIGRLENGFRNIGWKVIETGTPDLIFANGAPAYQEASNYKEIYNGKLILHVLDVPYHEIGKWNQSYLKYLQQADVITSNSITVKNNLKKYCGLDSEVVYNPIKDVCNLNMQRSDNFVYAGRARDPGKRFDIVSKSIQFLSEKLEKNSQLFVCGSEKPSYGEYLGIIPDDALNLLFNTNRWMIFPSSYEGIGLPPIEFMLTGGFSILTNDNEVFREIHPKEILVDPTPEAIIRQVIEIYYNKELQKHIHSLSAGYYAKFNKTQIARNIAKLL